MRSLISLSLLLLSAAALAAPAAPAPAPSEAACAPYLNVEPLSDEARAIFWGSPEDEEPEKLNATREDLENRHYLSGDERYLELFYPKIKDIGGGYMGVGSDQAYLFIGWMKPELAWLTDYDRWISWLHLSYFAFFEVSEDIKTFRSWWKRERYKDAKALLKERYKDRKDVNQIINVYLKAAYKANRRMRRLEKRMNSEKIPSFVTDESQYQYVRKLVMAGRIRPMLGNLLGKQALLKAGEAAKKLNVPLRVLYPSNAESYWKYNDQFRQNIQGLFTDHCGWVTRTIAVKPLNDDYVYNLQPIENFQRWLEVKSVRRVRQICPIGRISGPQDIPFKITDALPKELTEGKK
ncbi:hypothetical protein KKF91_13070 [Myxococcota bacterium]|nr:hypothetical protein [Myxococcota bacterium]MBU1431467.1 hypothetical protein [Myxococcota bacterium]MBU1898541.1 hypothetical protein [Myxococcota bacterium]